MTKLRKIVANSIYKEFRKVLPDSTLTLDEVENGDGFKKYISSV